MLNYPPNFSYQEMIDSNYATRHGINNECPDELKVELMATAWMLQTLRGRLSQHFNKEVPILVTSGYRCPKLNRAVGGSVNSDHMKAKAADIRVNCFTPYELAVFIKAHMSDYGWHQLILEHDRWIHISTANNKHDPENQCLTIRRNSQGKIITLNGIIGL